MLEMHTFASTKTHRPSCSMPLFKTPTATCIPLVPPCPPTLRAQAQVEKDKLTDGVQADPRVQAVMSRFPGTQLVEVRRIAPDTASGADDAGPVAAAEEDDDL